MTGIMDHWGRFKAVGRTVLEADKEKSEVKVEVTPEALNAAGQSCLAMATAITALAGKDMFDEARDLAEQLRNTSRTIRYLIRENRSSMPSVLDQPIDTKGMKLDRNDKVCQFIAGFLEGSPKRAIDVINKSLENGFNKNEIFKAKEVLGLEVNQRRGCKWWSLPDATA